MEHLARIPKDRIAVLIGKHGSTRKMIEKACGGSLHIESNSGDVSVIWPEGEAVDPIIKMKLPDDLSLFISSLAGAIVVENVGNSKFVDKSLILRQIEYILK